MTDIGMPERERHIVPAKLPIPERPVKQEPPAVPAEQPQRVDAPALEPAKVPA